MLIPRRLGHGEGAALVDHLGELRTRLIVMAIALTAGLAVTYTFHHDLIHWLNAPLPPGKKPVTLTVAEPFMTSLRVSLYAAVALASPVILWQVWSFLAPAFRKGTERMLFVFVAAATVLFAGGVAFGYAVALPAAIRFLTNYDSTVYNIQIRASSYYSFALLVLLSVGIVFELPIFIIALVRIGITSATKLRRNRRIGYAAMAILAVALPGVDPVTTAFEMLPLMILYEASIWISVLLERHWATSNTIAPTPLKA
jgi:sec-independent protein translocase protein TatC